ncbi:unnamed protein product, partial [Prunus brigantina]
YPPTRKPFFCQCQPSRQFSQGKKPCVHGRTSYMLKEEIEGLSTRYHSSSRATTITCAFTSLALSWPRLLQLSESSLIMAASTATKPSAARSTSW